MVLQLSWAAQDLVWLWCSFVPRDTEAWAFYLRVRASGRRTMWPPSHWDISALWQETTTKIRGRTTRIRGRITRVRGRRQQLGYVAAEVKQSTRHNSELWPVFPIQATEFYCKVSNIEGWQLKIMMIQLYFLEIYNKKFQIIGEKRKEKSFPSMYISSF